MTLALWFVCKQISITDFRGVFNIQIIRTPVMTDTESCTWIMLKGFDVAYGNVTHSVMFNNR